MFTYPISFFGASGAPKDVLMMFAETTGCPAGWTKVTGVDGRYMRVTTDTGQAGGTGAADASSHAHYGSICGNSSSGWGYLARGGNTDANSFTITYPAIKYLLCKKD